MPQRYAELLAGAHRPSMLSWMLAVQMPVAKRSSSCVSRCIGTINSIQQYGMACRATSADRAFGLQHGWLYFAQTRLYEQIRDGILKAAMVPEQPMCLS